MFRARKHHKSSAASRFVRLLLICAGIYLLVCAGCAMFQYSMIYFPQRYTPRQVDQMARADNLERWTNSSGELVGLKRLSPKRPAEGQVLITYGNASYAAGCAHYADDIQTAAAFDVFILEYPGYADRPGKPSQKSLFRAADEAFQLLSTNKPVFLLGESLGSGVAAYLAGTHPDQVAGIMLISPFNRLADVAQYRMPILPVRLLLVDRFPSEDYLRNYHGRVGVVVCGRDTVVPEKFGLRLYNNYAGPKRLWEFPNAGHIEIAEPPAVFWKEVVEFWQTNQISSAAR
ncbi:MAG TPA: alpha/beta fold hydrolase [Verrucomicrobiae bacterium]|nr:alpha/beta fold hydrolase [Verrucomicrobiae bacterium]